MFVQASNDAALETCDAEISSIKTLSGKKVKTMEVLRPDAPRPAGCVSYPVSTSAAVFLLVKGRVDMDAEIAKAQKKLDKAKSSIQRQEKILLEPGYKAKVSGAVYGLEEQRLADAQQEAAAFEATIKQFEQLKVE